MENEDLQAFRRVIGLIGVVVLESEPSTSKEIIDDGRSSLDKKKQRSSAAVTLLTLPQIKKQYDLCKVGYFAYSHT